MHLARHLAVCLFLLAPTGACRAMRFDFLPGALAGAPNLLSASGVITPGDEDRFQAALRAVPLGTRLAGLLLDSPGGDLAEGGRLAAGVRAAGLATVVASGARCASACFLVFAASPHRFASGSALLGVHSASFRGSDTVDAKAATVQLARRLSEYGVPDAILGKMVTAQPNQIWWLNRADLDSMRVDPDAPVATGSAVAVDVASLAPPPSTPAKPGFRIEPAAHGYQLATPAAGFRVWRPGAAP